MIRRLSVGFFVLVVGCSMAPSDSSYSYEQDIQDLLVAMHSFTEGWLVRGDLQGASAYLSREFVKSPALRQLLSERGESIDTNNASRIFKEFLEVVRNRMGEGDSLPEIIQSVPIDSDIHNVELPEPVSHCYSVFRLDSDSVNELASTESEAMWLAEQMKTTPLFMQAFKGRKEAPGKSAPILLVWRSEGTTWKILTIGSIGI